MKLTRIQLIRLYNEHSCADWKATIKAYLDSTSIYANDHAVDILDLDIERAGRFCSEDQKKSLIVEGVVFKPALPTKWSDIGKMCNKWYINGNAEVRLSVDLISNSNVSKNLCHTKEQAEAFLALQQLVYLRDIYRDGWVPTGADWIHVIRIYNGTATCDRIGGSYHRPLSFKSEELAKQFFSNFKDLIEIAKPLL